MPKENICPGCGRHCDLNEPNCGRGEEYRRTGKMPEKRHGKGQHDKTRMVHYHAADMNDKLIINLRDLGHMMRFLYEGKASQKRHEEMFSCLSEEEKQKLLSLLENVCNDWRTRYFENGDAHGHRGT